MMTQQTPLGLTYPEPGDHTRIWEHIQTLAEDVDGWLDARGDQYRPWVYKDNGTFTFTNGALNVTYGNTVPAGWEWAEPPTPTCQQRSNAFPTTPTVYSIGNTTTAGCTVHAIKLDGSPISGASAVCFTLQGFIKKSAV